MRRIWLLGALALALGVGPWARADAEKTSQQVLDCVASNVPNTDDLRSLRVTSTSRAGHERVTQIDAFGRRSREGERRLLLRFSKPAELEGSSFLIVEHQGVNEFYVHTPQLGDRRIAASELGGSLFGTDFSYEDIVRYQGMLEDSEVSRREDETVSGRAAYVLESQPPEGSSVYSRIVTAVDRERCVVLELRMYEHGEEPRKVLSTDPEDTLFINSYWIPQTATLRDVRDGSRTDVALQTVVTDLTIPDQLFDPKEFGQVKPQLEIDRGRPKPQIELDLAKPEIPAS